MYIVVTGAAGFIGSNLVQGAQCARRDGHHRRRQSRARRQVREPRRLRDRRLLRQGRVPRAPRRRRLRRRPRCRPAPGRVLGHDGDRRPVHDAQQLPLLRRRCSTALPGQRRPVSLRVERGGVRRQPRVPRGARMRGAAQRLRLLEVPVRPVRAPRAAASAPRRSRDSATSTSTVRAKRTRAGWRRSRCISSTSIAPTASVRLFEGSGGFAAGEQRRDFVSVDDVVGGRTSISSTIRERSGIFNLGTRTRGELQRRGRRRRSTRAARPTARRRATLARARRRPARSSTCRSRRRSPASTRASPRPT